MKMDKCQRFSLDEAFDFATRSCLACGASHDVAVSLSNAIVGGEARGQTSIGFAVLPDFLEALKDGRLDGHAEPAIDHSLASIIRSDARNGIAQLGFDRAFDRLVRSAKDLGMAAFAQVNSFPAAELGYYVERLAQEQLVAFAVTNGEAIMAPPGVAKPVYCTNPFAFAAPRRNGPPLLIDQALSGMAMVNIRARAVLGEYLPEGCAVDCQGQPTLSATEALRGHLLTFGGARGANIALMVEVLSAGLTGARWSLDVPEGHSGLSTGIGLFVFALEPSSFACDFTERLDLQLTRLADSGLHIPGIAKALSVKRASLHGLEIPEELISTIISISGSDIST